MQAVDINYISNKVCSKKTNEQGQSYGDWIHDDHLCAWRSGKDSCSGDSGSPLIQVHRSGSEEFLQVGIVSWGVRCAGFWPGVYTRLSFIYEWAKDYMCTYSRRPPRYMGCTASEPTLSPSLFFDPPRASMNSFPPGNATPNDKTKTQLFSGNNAKQDDTTPGTVDEGDESGMNLGSQSETSGGAFINRCLSIQTLLMLMFLTR